jgi:hypothetical protein
VLNNRTCACCGQSTADVRHGVKLTRLKARIFDAIERAGPAGIATRDLFDLVFANDLRRHAVSTLKAHVWQINQALLGTGLHVYGRSGMLRLIQNRFPRAKTNSCDRETRAGASRQIRT